MGFWGRLQRSLGWVEKAEGRYALLERIHQAWKIIKPIWPIVVLWSGGVGTTIASFWRTMTLPWFEPWVWSVGGLTVFFVSTGILLFIPYRRFGLLPPGAMVTVVDKGGYGTSVPITAPEQKEPTVAVNQASPPKSGGIDDLRETVELWYDARGRAAYIAARDLMLLAGETAKHVSNGHTINDLIYEHVYRPAWNFCGPFEQAIRGEAGRVVDADLMLEWLINYTTFLTWASRLSIALDISIADTAEYLKWKDLHRKLVDHTPVVFAGGRFTNIRQWFENDFDKIDKLQFT